MNIKKILIISLFLLILTNIVIDASYAVSSEKTEISYSKFTNTFDKKIAYIDEVVKWPNKKYSEFYYKVNIKKANQNKYKIQSVKCKYNFYDDITDKII